MNRYIDKPIHLIKTQEDADNFIKQCKIIYDDMKNHGRSFCGIDFEFNMNWKTKIREIGLMQIILIYDSDEYYDKNSTKPIYVLNPAKLSKKNREYMLNYIFCSDITKIFHGSDSLDYNYVYNDLLKKSKSNFIKFINNSLDTRFLCELSKRIMRRIGLISIESKKCSIYNALYDHQIINNKELSELSEIGSAINYNKKWLVDKLNDKQLLYSISDVFKLYDLLHNIVKRFSCVENKCIDVVSAVNRLYRFHMLNKFGLLDISTQCKLIIDNAGLDKKKINEIDEKILEIPITQIYYSNEKYKIDIYMNDFLSIDTIRKSILYCLRIFYINDNNAEKLDNIFDTSIIFNQMKGNNYIKRIIKIIKNKTSVGHSMPCI